MRCVFPSIGQLNVAIGSPEVGVRAQAAIADYYAFTGRAGWGRPITDPGELREAVAGWDALGADEVALYCYADQPEQVDALAAGVSDCKRPAGRRLPSHHGLGATDRGAGE